MLDRLKLVARWIAPTIILLFFYMAIWGVPSLPVAGLLSGVGILLSWIGPWTVKKIINLIDK